MIQKILICISLVFSVLVLSCTKDESAKDLLTATDCWQVLRYEIKDSTNAPWRAASIKSCEKDDCYAYFSDGDYKITYGTTPCDPSENKPYTATWELINGDTEIRYTTGSASLDIIEKIEKLTADTLITLYETGPSKLRTVYVR